ncbi:hypothetical protein RHMOL_Rhmol04G0237500 [Rhododendron molle]|uniref:Uncharacterized protein n=1 Tax=Rhododendron molle TaxID=49168 RepID=A0ACC0P3T5_RHOML|nr:hypothetical protein RHMOL_Rhmol04G0237500 [Rhododendron molle]
MASSSTTNSKGCDALDLRYVQKKCRCGKRAAIRVVESEKPSKGKLYYVCDSEPRGCDTWAWCKPVRIIHVEDEKVEESPMVEERPRVEESPRVVHEDPHLMARLVMVEANMEAFKTMMKWVWWTPALCVLCTILVLIMK